VTVGDLDLGARVRLDSFRGIEGYDEEQARITQEIALADRRMQLAGTAALRVPRTRLVVGATAQHIERMGDVGEARASRRESSFSGTISARF